MYFQKCSQCGFLTLVNDTPDTWCFNCTSRFPVYYKKWKMDNPGKNLDDFKGEVGLAFSGIDLKHTVSENNKQALIKNPTKSQVKRRSYLRAGYPLDRGGFTEYSSMQARLYLLGAIMVIVGVLIMYFFDI